MQERFIGFIIGMVHHAKRVGDGIPDRPLMLFVDFAVVTSPRLRLPAPEVM